MAADVSVQVDRTVNRARRVLRWAADELNFNVTNRVHLGNPNVTYGNANFGRIINTSSEAGLSGPVGQANYGAAKAAISALTVTAARGLERYGVRANAICPRARTAMTADVFGPVPELADGEIDPLSPEHVVTLVRFLAAPASDHVNGQVFVVYGPTVTLVAAPTAEHRFHADGTAWDPEGLSASMRDYFADRDPQRTFGAMISMDPD